MVNGMLDDKSDAELFAQMLEGGFYDDHPWEAIHALRTRATHDIYRRVTEWLNEGDSKERARALNVLAQFGHYMENHKGYFVDERLSFAIKHMADKDQYVAEAAAWVLANMRGDIAVTELLKVQDSANDDVRHAVATGLMGETSPEAISCLIKLMNDTDDDVRDWATFSLGSEIEPDSPEIREALRKRLSDPVEDVRWEAIWALATRRDSDGLRLLLESLEEEDKWRWGDKDAVEKILRSSGEITVEFARDSIRKILAGNEGSK